MSVWQGQRRRRLLIGILAFGAAVALAVLLPVGRASAQETCTGCHAAVAGKMAGAKHANLSCLTCHPDAADHPMGYKMPSATGYFQLEVCRTCHPDQFGTYNHDDGRGTEYGGSPLGVPKSDYFPFYNTIIDGHGFVRDYNEERTHKYMMKDHAEIKRGKFEVCLQCKSTRVAYYWGTGKTAVLQNSHEVEWAPTGETIVVPAGTQVKLGTDTTGQVTGVPYQVMAEVLWDGVLYTTYDKQGAVWDQKRTWVATYAMAIDGLPDGSPSIDNTATCNHCHDPHATDFRLIRKELMRVVDEKGVDPTNSEKTSFANATRAEKINTVCGQCHVEYVCGRSGVDGKNRDFFPWAKVSDLEAIYEQVFPTTDELGLAAYSQDWIHGSGVRASAWPPNAPEYPIGVPLAKNQHPETETYWGSPHDDAGASCADCHMPKVTKTSGKTFSSHWLSSPLKYLDQEAAEEFATSFDLKTTAEGVINSCARCHSESAAKLSDEILEYQDEVYTEAKVVEGLLVDSLKAINTARGASGADLETLRWAVDRHRAAHIRWENLIISENSMGRHNHGEVMDEILQAERWSRIGAREAKVAVAPLSTWTPSDVPATDSVRPSIDFLAERAIVGGRSDGSFGQYEPTLRAQMAKILTGAFGMHDEAVADRTPTYRDVPFTAAAYPFDFVEEAARWGVVKGYTDGTFRPYEGLTRIQLARMLVRVAGQELEQPSPGYSSGFRDVPAADTAGVALLKYNGIVTGKSATSFDPYGTATRGHVARMVHGLIEETLTP